VATLIRWQANEILLRPARHHVHIPPLDQRRGVLGPPVERYALLALISRAVVDAGHAALVPAGVDQRVWRHRRDTR
jgi:hypothetical protein